MNAIIAFALRLRALMVVLFVLVMIGGVIPQKDTSGQRSVSKTAPMLVETCRRTTDRLHALDLVPVAEFQLPSETSGASAWVTWRHSGRLRPTTCSATR
jgi:hypothetical protein